MSPTLDIVRIPVLNDNYVWLVREKRATVLWSSPVIGRAQGWRYAPPPAAAAALPPSAHRSGGHPCRRRRAPSASTGFHHCFVDALLFQPIQQLPTPLGAIAKRRFRATPYRHIDLQFGDIDADKRPLLCHHPAPFLARCGLRPMQLFGFRKTLDLSLARFQASAFGTCGLRLSDGRLLQQPPVRTFWPSRRTQGTFPVASKVPRCARDDRP
jgi:hypothetical protein